VHVPILLPGSFANSPAPAREWYPAERALGQGQGDAKARERASPITVASVNGCRLLPVRAQHLPRARTSRSLRESRRLQANRDGASEADEKGQRGGALGARSGAQVSRATEGTYNRTREPQDRQGQADYD